MSRAANHQSNATATVTDGAPRTWGMAGVPVPYVTAWSEERVRLAGQLTVRSDGSGLCYRDETRADRDTHGVLWARVNGTPGNGRPQFRHLHPARQRRAMIGRLCQVCGGPAERTSRGWLFLLPRPAVGECGPDWPEGAFGTKPPICRPCVALAVRYCPHLSDAVLVHVRKPRLHGVFGGPVIPDTTTGRLTTPEDGYLTYGAPTAPWFLATQLTVELRRCTVTATGPGMG